MDDSSRAHIREATRADIPAIARLAREFAEYMCSLGDETEFRLNAHALQRDGFDENAAFQGLVAERGGDLAGYLLYHNGYDSDGACRIMFVADLFVTKEARGERLGTALMRHARAIAAERGAKQLVWTVDRRNVAAQQFYQQMGAEFVSDVHLMSLKV